MGHVGQEADLNGLFDVKVLAKRAANHDALDVGETDAHAARQRREAGVDGRLGAQQIGHIDFGEQDIVGLILSLVFPGDDVFLAVLSFADARCLHGIVEPAAFGEQSGDE